MISTRHIRKFCYEDPSLIENYDKAIADTTQIWEIHHRVESIMNCSREDLKAKGCYENRPAHDLIFMTKAEHRSLHHAGNTYMCGRHFSEEHRAKIAAALKGKHRSEEVKAKIAESHKGKHLTSEHKDKLSKILKGKHIWNNGVKNMFSLECPGPEWKKGFLPRKKKS